jgi:thioredoxin reductase (NADPH)
MLDQQRAHLARYGVQPKLGIVTALRLEEPGFVATIETEGAPPFELRARRVLLATGSVDQEPPIADLRAAMEQGLLRYCPVCDGYEARGQRVAVIGEGTRGLGEAIFMARTYSNDVTLLATGDRMRLSEQDQARLDEHGVKVVVEPVSTLVAGDGRISALHAVGAAEPAFDTIYSAFGLEIRSGLAVALGAEHDENGALIVDAHNQTTVSGLYAAGDVVRGLNQIVVAMGHAAAAATDIHNRCEIPTGDEPERRQHTPSIA